MSPLSEHPLTLSVNCSSSFQHPWWNLCFNYLMFFIASFQFMILHKPASTVLACIAGRSGINDNATEGHSVLVLTFLRHGNVVACNGSEHLGIWCLQTKIMLFSLFPESFLFLKLFSGEHCSTSTWALKNSSYQRVSNVTNVPDLTQSFILQYYSSLECFKTWGQDSTKTPEKKN